MKDSFGDTIIDSSMLSGLTREQSNKIYLNVMQDKDEAAMRSLCKYDLFFLLTVGCKRKDINRPWLYERCREVQLDPDGVLDLWAREHYKSTIITFGLTIQDILKDPEVTVGIFSHTRPQAKSFLDQIKREFEGNTFLQDLFPDVLYKSPKKEAPVWSLDSGILVKRKTNPKEVTIEAHGLVDGQPIGKHYSLRVYDDVVTDKSVTTPEQIKKTTDAFSLSTNLGAHGGRVRYIGTRYHFSDTWGEIIDREIARPRIHAATDTGLVDGKPVFLTENQLAEKKREQGSYIFSCQMLQNPVADNAQGFKLEWLRYYDRLGDISGWNKYLFVDPANEKKKENDYTVMAVIAAGPDNNYYLVDAIRDRLNLTERTELVFSFVRRYGVKKTLYEHYGIQSDIQHIQYVMEQDSFRFPIFPIGGATPKNDRIKRLIPVFETFRFWLPHRLLYVDREKKAKDFIHELINEEYIAFPVSKHDDMLDCLARCVDPMAGVVFPKPVDIRGESVTQFGGNDTSVAQTEYKVL